MYKRKTIDKWKHDGYIIMFFFFLLSLIPNLVSKMAVLAYPADEKTLVEPIHVVKNVPIGCETQKCEIMAYILEVFQDDADDAITILNKCENSALDPDAYNWNRNGTSDMGVFQINSVHGYSIEYLRDWRNNVDVAYKIFQSRGWSAWACSHVVGVRSFWQ